MGSFERCGICGEFHWTEEKCKPVYQYQIPDYHYHGDDDWSDVRAQSSEEAAEKACMIEDCQGDYDIIASGSLDEIKIRDPDGVVRRFFIEAESVPEYTAREITEVKP